MADAGIVAVIALGDKGVEYDGWVYWEDLRIGDERLRPLLRPVRALVVLDGGGYDAFVARRALVLNEAERAWQEGGYEAAKAAIERHASVSDRL